MNGEPEKINIRLSFQWVEYHIRMAVSGFALSFCLVSELSLNHLFSYDRMFLYMGFAVFLYFHNMMKSYKIKNMMTKNYRGVPLTKGITYAFIALGFFPGLILMIFQSQFYVLFNGAVMLVSAYMIIVLCIIVGRVFIDFYYINQSDSRWVAVRIAIRRFVEEIFIPFDDNESVLDSLKTNLDNSANSEAMKQKEPFKFRVAYLTLGTRQFIRKSIVWLMVILARCVRLKKEGLVYQCPQGRCGLYFENPELTFVEARKHKEVKTWPMRDAPLFATCEISSGSHRAYPTWRSISEALSKALEEENDTIFKYQFCELDFCKLDFCSKTVCRVLLVCMDERLTTEALAQILQWYGESHGLGKRESDFMDKIDRASPLPLRMQLPDRFETKTIYDTDKIPLFEITLYNPDSGLMWARGYDWVIIVPKHADGDFDAIHPYIGYALGNLVVPNNLGNKNDPHQLRPLPTRLNRLFGNPGNDPPPKAYGRGVVPKIGVWTKTSLNGMSYQGEKILSILKSKKFETFIKEIKA